MSANPPSSGQANKYPAPSGPRWAWRLFMRSNTIGSTGVPSNARMPTIPHMGARTLRRRAAAPPEGSSTDRKSTRLNSSHLVISYAVFCLKKKKKTDNKFYLRDTTIKSHRTTTQHLRTTHIPDERRTE